jgi:hypothetical protein
VVGEKLDTRLTCKLSLGQITNATSSDAIALGTVFFILLSECDKIYQPIPDREWIMPDL